MECNGDVLNFGVCICMHASRERAGGGCTHGGGTEQERTMSRLAFALPLCNRDIVSYHTVLHVLLR